MKVNFTRLATFALAIGVNYSAFSQNWELSGNAIGATDYLGTNNNFPLRLRTVQSQPIKFFTGNTQRMTILGADNLLGSPQFATERAGNVGIGTRHPLTLLHMGGEGASGAGWRDWMDIGTYYASRGGFDNMYVGLRRLSSDRNEAIINFGNNPSSNGGNGGNGDQLRFVFSAAPGNGIASSNDGFEIARMWVDGLDNGRMGIGDFFTAGTQPQNTLEIMASESSPYWNQPDGTS